MNLHNHVAMEQRMSAHQVLDLRHKHFHKDRRGLSLIGTWMSDESGQYRPCMVIMRAGEEKSDFTRPCIIPLERAWIWDEKIGDQVECAHTLASFMLSLRISPDDANIRMLYSLVNEYLGALLTIPPIASLGLDKETVAEVTRIDMETGEVFETEVKAHV